MVFCHGFATINVYNEKIMVDEKEKSEDKKEAISEIAAGGIAGVLAGSFLSYGAREMYALEHAKQIGVKYGRVIEDFNDVAKFMNEAKENASIKPEIMDVNAHKYQNYWIGVLKEIKNIYKEITPQENIEIFKVFAKTALVAAVVVGGGVFVYNQITKEKPSNAVDANEVDIEKLNTSQQQLISK
jgi:hypothetical protein